MAIRVCAFTSSFEQTLQPVSFGLVIFGIFLCPCVSLVALFLVSYTAFSWRFVMCYVINSYAVSSLK